jgi:predicted ribosome quality control (RQC) complex YloA/Tae2 family protein
MKQSIVLLVLAAITLLTGCATMPQQAQSLDERIAAKEAAYDAKIDALILAQSKTPEGIAEAKAKAEEKAHNAKVEADRKASVKRKLDEYRQEKEQLLQYKLQALQALSKLKVGMAEEQVKALVGGFVRHRSMSDGVGGQFILVTYGISNHEEDDWYLTFVDGKLIRWFHTR